ncbi:MAG: hypothetical protein Kow0099_04070 [Candidatus Abyssubacteria bacterium]
MSEVCRQKLDGWREEGVFQVYIEFVWGQFGEVERDKGEGCEAEKGRNIRRQIPKL